MINWILYVKPFQVKECVLYSTCLFKDYVIAVGEADSRPFMVIINKDSGNILRTWKGAERGYFARCSSVEDRLYVAGNRIENGYRGIIYLFNEDFNLVKKEDSKYYKYSSIAFNGQHLYLGGSGTSIWYTERRDLDLTLVDIQKLHTAEDNALHNIEINPVTGELWVVGWYSHNRILVSLLTILDPQIIGFRKIEYSELHRDHLGYAHSISFDILGNAYVSGTKRSDEPVIAKFDKWGKLINVIRGVPARQIFAVGDRVYAFGSEHNFKPVKPVLHVLDLELNVVEKYILSEDQHLSSYFTYGKPSYDGSNIYVAGYEAEAFQDERRGVVYSIAVTPNPSGTRVFR